MPDAISSYINKANESLESAKADFGKRRYNSCANRAYYACFQAAAALLTRCGITSKSGKGAWKHQAIQAQIATLIKRRKILPSGHKDTLSQLMGARLIADYEPHHITKKTANRVLKKAREFVSMITKEVSK